MKEKLWEIEQLQARIAELEADNANLNDWLNAWKESFNLAQAEIAKLQADNRSLVEQMNEMALKPNIKTMQDLAATFPDIYREHKLLCHAQKTAGSVVITVIDKHNNSFQVVGGTIDKAYENLMYWVNTHEAMLATVEGCNPCES